jgi:hypothetical protein
VTELYGPHEAKVSADDWLDEFIATPSQSADQSRHAVTIAASRRLANRLSVAEPRRSGCAVQEFVDI